MTAADLPLAMRLKEQAGWNQTEADWRRFLETQADGCFVAELGGAAVGTTTTWRFGPVAWVAMVLVDAAVRGRGVGTALMEYALAHLTAAGIHTVRLDATPLGQPVYEKLGFTAEYQLARLAGVLPPEDAVAGVATAAAADLDELARLDHSVTGTDRRDLLARLFAERPEAMRLVRRGGAITGFTTSRLGSRAVQIGPCLGDAAAGPLLLADAAHRYAGQFVYIDVPVDHDAATEFARSRGLTVQRHLLRMSRGEPVRERVEGLWASSGPEKG
jgi:GNAT superfamily N-acetyltransferase